MTDDEADAAFAKWLADTDRAACPQCGKAIDRGDVAWNNADTDAGTPFTVGHIQCQRCDTEIADWNGWWPGADDWPEFVERVLPDCDGHR